MKRYEYLLFDADNTLFDFSLAEYISFGETCRQGGIAYSEELYVTYSEINDGLWKRIEKKEITLEFLKTERFRLLLIAMGWADDTDTLRKAEELRDIFIETLGQHTLQRVHKRGALICGHAFGAAVHDADVVLILAQHLYGADRDHDHEKRYHNDRPFIMVPEILQLVVCAVFGYDLRAVVFGFLIVHAALF